MLDIGAAPYCIINVSCVPSMSPGTRSLAEISNHRLSKDGDTQPTEVAMMPGDVMIWRYHLTQGEILSSHPCQVAKRMGLTIVQGEESSLHGIFNRNTASEF